MHDVDSALSAALNAVEESRNQAALAVDVLHELGDGRRAPAPLTWSSTKEEVLAAVEDSARRIAAVEDRIRRGDTEGIVMCRGTGIVGVDGLPEMVRQAAAGEEDQSVPGWDQGA